MYSVVPNVCHIQCYPKSRSCTVLCQKSVINSVVQKSVMYSVVPNVCHVQCCAKSRSCTVMCQKLVMYSVVPKVGQVYKIIYAIVPLIRPLLLQ